MRVSACDLSAKGKTKLIAKAKALHDRGISWRDIGDEIGISSSTLQRWKCQDMSQKSQKCRLSRRGLFGKLSAEEENQLIHAAKQMRIDHRSVTIDWTITKVTEITNGGWTPSAGWASKFWEKNGWPSLASIPRNLRECRNTLEEEAHTFQAEIHTLASTQHIPPSHIWAEDESGVWTGGYPPRTYVNPETKDAGVLQEGNHHRDTIAVALSADGDVHLKYVDHRPQKTRTRNGVKVIVEKGISGVGIPQMEEFAEGFSTDHPDAELIMMDALAAHKNKSVEGKFNHAGMTIKIMPPQTAKLISPLDNPFFGIFKAKLRKEDTSTAEKKRAAVEKLCRETTPDMVKSCWAHAGWHFQ
jgi:transposase